jgi:hypothetical protein
MRSRQFTGLAIVALVPAFAACGETDSHPNKDRPAAAINVTAAIIDGRVQVSPRRFGAGPIRLLITNQSGTEQAVTFETAGSDSGITRSTAPIRPDGTATLEVDGSTRARTRSAPRTRTSSPRRSSRAPRARPRRISSCSRNAWGGQPHYKEAASP